MAGFWKPRAPSLNSPRTLQLLRSAVNDLNYDAVLLLHSIYGRMAPAEGLWDWWLDQAEDAARRGDQRTAALAVAFARKANVEPWGPLTSEHYQRMRSIERS